MASAKTFDMRVVSKTEAPDHVFSAISKEEVEPISGFLQSKNVRLKNEMDEAMEVDPITDDDIDDDDDDATIPSEGEERGKSKRDKGVKGTKKAADDDEDESGELMIGPLIMNPSLTLNFASQRMKISRKNRPTEDHPARAIPRLGPGRRPMRVIR